MGLELVDSLAVKYRPTKLSDIVGNDTPLSIIKGNLSQGKMFKAVIMAGEPGCGKTTTARLLAMIANCEEMGERISKGILSPCGKCDSCRLALKGNNPDIMEVDSGVDGGKNVIRSVIDTARFAPRYNVKAAIIDEAHNLSSASKEALLKSLEEPPKNFLWILCSTEPEKFNQAIMGRCVKLYFSYPSINDMSKRLWNISKKEFPEEMLPKIKPYIRKICESTRCQPRNSLTLLDTLSAIISANPSKNEEELEALLTKALVALGDITGFSIKFITNLMSGYFSLPLGILNDIEQTRISEFITNTLRHAHYMSYYYSCKYEKTDKIIRTKFYGINFVRYDSALDTLWEKLSSKKNLNPKQIIGRSIMLSSALIQSTESIRRGLVTPEQALVLAINNYMQSVSE